MKNCNLVLSTLMLVFFFSSQISAQNKIGLGFSSDPLHAVSLNYSKSIDEKKQLNFALTYGYSNLDISRNLGLVDQGDTGNFDGILRESITNTKQHLKCFAGIERQIKSSPFSWGLDLSAGWYKASGTHLRGIQQYDSLGAIIGNGLSILEQVYADESNFLTAGLQVSMAMNFDVSKKVNCKFFLAITGDNYFYQNTNEIFNSINYEGTLGSSFALASARLGCVFYLKKGTD